MGAVNGDYAQPVTVNGFSCKNCTDVDNAKKHIDPSHPKDGPYGVNAQDKISATDKVNEPAVVLSGQLSDARQAPLAQPYAVATGGNLDASA
jgi:hypothetical protein